MKKALAALNLLFLALIVDTPTTIAKDRKFLPKSAPVNMRIPGQDQRLAGVGYNQLTVATKWEDDFFTFESEVVGELEYTVSNIAVGFIDRKEGEAAKEWDLLVGKIDGKNKTTRYFSTIRSKDVNVSSDGDGWDLGVRIVYLDKLGQTQLTETMGIDWVYAFSYHIALFSLSSTVTALSVDGQDGNTYNEDEFGLFLRPFASIQPQVHLLKWIDIIPFAAVGTKVLLSSYEFEDTEVILAGSSQPGQLSDDAGFNAAFDGAQFLFGFDFAFRLGRDYRHEIRMGGAFNKIFGSGDSNFSEVHIFYSQPWN